MRRAGSVILGLVLVVLLASAAEGAVPDRIEIGGVVLGEEDAIRLYPSLCSTTSAGEVSDRPSVPVVVAWTVTNNGKPEEELWRGRFYPRHGNEPPAIDIPEWVAYGADGAIPRTCDDRLVSVDAIDILENAGVPVASGDIANSTSSPPSFAIALGVVALGVLLLLVLRVGFARRRRRNRSPNGSRS